MIYMPLPGEYIASAVRRGLETKGINTIKKHDYEIKRNNKLRLILPPKFAEHNITEDLLRQNTLFPLAQALGHTTKNATYTPLQNWKICLECVNHDIKNYGTSYIHCRNLPTVITHCSVHATELFKKCPSCLKPITKHRLVDFESCQESFPTTTQHLNSPRHKLAIFVTDLLAYYGKAPGSKDVEREIFQKLVAELYDGDFAYAYTNIMRDASTQLGIDIAANKPVGLSLSTSAALAFFAFQNSGAYIESAMKLANKPQCHVRKLVSSLTFSQN